MAFVFMIPGPLRAMAGGLGEVRVDGAAASVNEALTLLWDHYPGVRDRVLTERGDVRPHVHIFVNGESIRDTGGLAGGVPEGAEIFILPALSGG